MGTSTGYDAPTTPQWSDLKSDITRLARDGKPNTEQSREVIRKYINSNGGSKNISQGKGVVSSNSAQRTASKISGFLFDVRQYGFEEALHRLNVKSYKGMNTLEFTLTLTDFLSESATSLDDADSRNALSRLMEELFNEAADVEELNSVLEQKLEEFDIEGILIKFFSYYLYEQFCRVFYERLVTRVGDIKAESFLSGIYDYIISEVHLLNSEDSLTSTDWGSIDLNETSSDILNRTLTIYGG
ncbi:hypothetical protein [Planococcus sp. 107-1]|uniref:hypothetical protein n=1 Tax=Planococcus sp. 107-1 TaxID=2908840 RepID=UPI001F4788C7|nr:hypothetical protein [Planococcus sp. 107-1]UJF27924.1 hypothetical protein L0M13_05875 [Planococcus sp. 107-1]